MACESDVGNERGRRVFGDRDGNCSRVCLRLSSTSSVCCVRTEIPLSLTAADQSFRSLPLFFSVGLISCSRKRHHVSPSFQQTQSASLSPRVGAFSISPDRTYGSTSDSAAVVIKTSSFRSIDPRAADPSMSPTPQILHWKRANKVGIPPHVRILVPRSNRESLPFSQKSAAKRAERGELARFLTALLLLRTAMAAGSSSQLDRAGSRPRLRPLLLLC